MPTQSRIFFWPTLVLLLAALLLLGMFSEQIMLWLIVAWQKMLLVVGLAQLAQHLQQGVDAGITKRPLPAVATYTALYLATCLLLLKLVLRPVQWRLAFRLYTLGLGLYVLLTIVAKLVGGLPWLYRLSRQLLDFIASPLPVAGLYVLFRAGFGPAAGVPAQRGDETNGTNGPVLR